MIMHYDRAQKWATLFSSKAEGSLKWRINILNISLKIGIEWDLIGSFNLKANKMYLIMNITSQIRLLTEQLLQVCKFSIQPELILMQVM